MKPIMVIICMLCSGCTVYQYAPSPLYVPFHSRKGQINGTATLSSVQGSYSLSDHIYISGSAFFRTRRDSWGTGKEHGGGSLGYEKSRDFKFGVGYFRTNNKFYQELVAGAGWGNLEYTHEIDISPGYEFNQSNNTQSLFLQPSLGYITKKIELALSPRFNYVRYLNIQTQLDQGYQDVDPDDASFLNQESLDFMFLEPAITLRAGAEKFWFNAQTGAGIKLTSTSINNKGFFLHVGVAFRLDTRSNAAGQ